jgi:hypothetical protein
MWLYMGEVISLKSSAWLGILCVLTLFAMPAMAQNVSETPAAVTTQIWKPVLEYTVKGPDYTKSFVINYNGEMREYISSRGESTKKSGTISEAELNRFLDLMYEGGFFDLNIEEIAKMDCKPISLVDTVRWNGCLSDLTTCDENEPVCVAVKEYIVEDEDNSGTVWKYKTYENVCDACQASFGDRQKMIGYAKGSCERLGMPQVACDRSVPAHYLKIMYEQQDSAGNVEYRMKEIKWRYLAKMPAIVKSALEHIKKFESLLKEESKIRYVKLDTRFTISEGWTAIVRETGLKVKVTELAEGLVEIEVRPGVVYAQTKDVAAQDIVKRMVLKPGERKIAYEHVITLNSIMVSESYPPQYHATFTISRKTEPSKVVHAYLGQKFGLYEGQVALVHKKPSFRAVREGTAERMPPEYGETVMKVALLSINIEPLYCTTTTSERESEARNVAGVCGNVTIARLVVSTKDGTTETFYINKGESRQIGLYRISFIGVEGKQAYFVVRQVIAQPIKNVRLGERFKLNVGETAFVVGQGVFIQLKGIVSAQVQTSQQRPEIIIPPQQKYAIVKIWKVQKPVPMPIRPMPPIQKPASTNITSKETTRIQTSPQPSVLPIVGMFTAVASKITEQYMEAQNATVAMLEELIEIHTGTAQGAGGRKTEYDESVVKKVMPYLSHTHYIREGQTIYVYEIALTAEEVGSDAAVFVVERAEPPVKNVHVGEPFTLKEEQSANVIEAYMRINLLEIVAGEKEVPMKPLKDLEEQCKDEYGEIVCPDIPEMPILKKYVRFTIVPVPQPKNMAVSVPEKEKPTTIDRIRDVATSVVTEDVVYDTSTVIQPAIKIYELSEGESIEYNNYTITVKRISWEKAEFLVEEKSIAVFTIYIYKGWNLFSLPGFVRPLASSECNSHKFKLLKWTEGKFVKVVRPTFGEAYWLYNPSKECKAELELKTAVESWQLPELKKGWNFVPVLLDMEGMAPTELGNCEVMKAYFYDSKGKRWEEITQRPFEINDLGKAFVMYVKKPCKLAGTLAPPALPPVEEIKKYT